MKILVKIVLFLFVSPAFAGPCSQETLLALAGVSEQEMTEMQDQQGFSDFSAELSDRCQPY